MPLNKFRHRTVQTTENDALCNYLRSKRKEAGMTLDDMSRLLNVPSVQISKVENRRRRLDVIELIRYCRALGIDPIEAIKTVSKV